MTRALSAKQVQEIAERVAAGARFLDEHDPGWFAGIDLETLDLALGSNCVLGQRQGSYREGAVWLAETAWLAGIADSASTGLDLLTRLGFDAGSSNWSEIVAEYAILTTAWTLEIERRRAADAARDTTGRDANHG